MITGIQETRLYVHSSRLKMAETAPFAFKNEQFAHFLYS